MRSSINENQRRSRLSSEVEIHGRNRNFDLRLILYSQDSSFAASSSSMRLGFTKSRFRQLLR